MWELVSGAWARERPLLNPCRVRKGDEYPQLHAGRMFGGEQVEKPLRSGLVLRIS